MLISIKKIPGNECNIEVSTNSTIIYVKELVEKHLGIRVSKQKLVFKGKTLSDNMCLKDYDISDGHKIHLFAVESNTSSSEPTIQTNAKDLNQFWDQLSQMLQKYYSKGDTMKIVDEFRRNLRSDVDELSLDDIERLAKIKLSQQ